MSQRLYFMLPTFDSARRTANDLLLARVDDSRMHFLARRGTNLNELHEASYLQKSDVIHAGQLGFVIGALLGLALVLGYLIAYGQPATQPWLLMMPPLVFAFLGTWTASMVGASVPNSRHKIFERDLAAGGILLMVDVPGHRTEEVQTMIQKLHPEAAVHGIEPSIPAFP